MGSICKKWRRLVEFAELWKAQLRKQIQYEEWANVALLDVLEDQTKG